MAGRGLDHGGARGNSSATAWARRRRGGSGPRGHAPGRGSAQSPSGAHPPPRRPPRSPRAACGAGPGRPAGGGGRVRAGRGGGRGIRVRPRRWDRAGTALSTHRGSAVWARRSSVSCTTSAARRLNRVSWAVYVFVAAMLRSGPARRQRVENCSPGLWAKMAKSVILSA